MYIYYIYLPVYTYLSSYLSIHLFIYLSIYLFIYLFIHLSDVISWSDGDAISKAGAVSVIRQTDHKTLKIRDLYCCQICTAVMTLDIIRQ